MLSFFSSTFSSSSCFRLPLSFFFFLIISMSFAENQCSPLPNTNCIHDAYLARCQNICPLGYVASGIMYCGEATDYVWTSDGKPDCIMAFCSQLMFPQGLNLSTLEPTNTNGPCKNQTVRAGHYDGNTENTCYWGCLPGYSSNQYSKSSCWVNSTMFPQQPSWSILPQCHPPCPPITNETIVFPTLMNTCLNHSNISVSETCKRGCSDGYTVGNQTNLLNLECLPLGVNSSNWSKIENVCQVEIPKLQNCTLTCLGGHCVDFLCVSPLDGGANVTIGGIFFNSTGVKLVNSDGNLIDVQNFYFINNFTMIVTTPKVTTDGLHRLYVYNHVDKNAFDQLSLIDYSQKVNPSCWVKGWWLNRGGECVPCPEGSICPGGDRIWPQPGYWSPDQYTQPLACPMAQGCPGVTNLEVSEQDTAICATEFGYSGAYCSTCLQSYYRVYEKCLTCSQLGDKQGKIELAILALITVAIFSFIALAVATLREPKLTLSVHIIIIFQILVQILGIASAKIPYPLLTKLVGYASLINFNIEFVQPGCAIGGVTWIGIFWGSLILMIFAVFLLFLGALIYACHKKRPTQKYYDAFRRRFIFSLQCLFSITYLQLCLRSFEGLVCENRLGVWVLAAEVDIVCFKGRHLPVSLIILFGLFPLILGFPIFTFIGMRRSQKKKGGLSEDFRREMYGFIYRYIKPEYYWVRLLPFFYNFCLALETSLTVDPTIQVFIAGLMYLVYIIVGFTLWPLIHNWRNYFYCLQGISTVVTSVVSLGMIKDWPYFITLDVLFLVVMLYVLGLVVSRRKKYFQQYELCRADPKGDEPDPQETDDMWESGRDGMILDEKGEHPAQPKEEPQQQREGGAKQGYGEELAELNDVEGGERGAEDNPQQQKQPQSEGQGGEVVEGIGDGDSDDGYEVRENIKDIQMSVLGKAGNPSMPPSPSLKPASQFSLLHQQDSKSDILASSQLTRQTSQQSHDSSSALLQEHPSLLQFKRANSVDTDDSTHTNDNLLLENKIKKLRSSSSMDDNEIEHIHIPSSSASSASSSSSSSSSLSSPSSAPSSPQTPLSPPSLSKEDSVLEDPSGRQLEFGDKEES